MNETVLLDCKPPIARISLNRPEKLNAINNAMLHGLLDAISVTERETTIQAVVLHGCGRAFSAGGDIKAMEAMDQPDFATTISLYMQLAAAFRAARKPIIAAVHGYAYAGGFELALLCDIRIAAEKTRFALPDAALGLSPTSGMTYLLPRIVGLGRALHLALTGETVDASEALGIGLVTKVVPSDDLLPTAEEYATRIASYPRVGIASTKEGFLGALDLDFAAASTREYECELRCFAASDVKACFQHFLTGRARLL